MLAPKFYSRELNKTLILSALLIFTGVLSIKLLSNDSYDIRQQAQVYCTPIGEFCGTGSQFPGTCCDGSSCENSICKPTVKTIKTLSDNSIETTAIDEAKQDLIRVIDISPQECSYLSGCYLAASGPYASSCYQYNAKNAGFICCNGQFKSIATEGESCLEPKKIVLRPSPTPTPVPVTPRPTAQPIHEVSESECKQEYNGCFVPPNGEYIASCIPHDGINGGIICCNQQFFEAKRFPTQQCTELVPVGDPDYKSLKQNDERWRDIPLPGGCSDSSKDRFSASTCGPFSAMMLITNSTGEEIDPITFVNNNYPNLNCSGSTVEQNVAVLNQYDMTTVYISTDPNEMRRYIKGGWDLFVRSHIDNIYHFILITGLDDNGNYVFEDPYYNAYASQPEILSVIAVKHKI